MVNRRIFWKKEVRHLAVFSANSNIKLDKGKLIMGESGNLP
jgi:hypothetical protein